MSDQQSLLVVDDETAIAELLARHLRKAGYRVTLAFTAEEAIQAMDVSDFDLIITDIRMPGQGGLVLIDVARERDEALPVIVLTSVNDVDTAVGAMRAGAHDYIVKPFVLEQIEIAVERALEKRSLIKENRRIHQKLELKVEDQTKQLRYALMEVQSTFNATIEAMVSAIEARDCETQNHCRRAREYALLLARRMGIKGRALRDVGWGSLLHDVGKIGVPDHILLKPGPLTPAEWDQMRKHPVIGYRLLTPVKFLQGAAPVVLHHHERWDGTGYPYGKEGEQIPLGARIFMVADAYETITSRRSYKRALPYEVAAEEIVRSSGSHFDPKVVDTFLRIPKEQFEEIRLKYIADQAEIPRILARQEAAAV